MSGAEQDAFTWDDPDQPYRADIEALGGLFEDDTNNAPDKSSDPYAGMLNEHTRHLAGLNRIIGSAILWVEFSAGNPVVVKAKGMRSVLNVDDFTATLDGGNGQILITWAAPLLPPLEAVPRVTLNEGPGSAWGELVPGNATAVKVFTVNMASAGTNLKFNVELH